MVESTWGAHASSNSTIASVRPGCRSKTPEKNHVAHRERRIEGFRRSAARVPERFLSGAADLALASRGRVQAERHVERLGGSPERFVFGLVVAPVLERMLGDHRSGEAHAGGALQLPDAVLDIVQVDHRDALEPRPVRAAKVGEPVVVRAKDGGHQRSVRHPEVKEALGWIQHLAGDPVELHVSQVLIGVVPTPRHVFEAPLTGDRLGGLEPRAGVRDEPDTRDDLIHLDHELVGAVDPLHPGRPIAERRVDPRRPQIGRLEDVRIGRENQCGDHRHVLLDVKMF